MEENLIHTKSVDYAFNLISKLTGELESIESNRFKSDETFQNVIKEIAKLHSDLIFKNEEIESLNCDNQRILESLEIE
ncbi:hypothetical protein [Lysinibacillus sp. Bpr_S20]|uniref:hypothetical protein n=1 Tax=Lysinibacillus sp. Bpr_S20 TaxID=2933964 RepID=UPI0020114C65|nr:hypothetical protein [Lysinibacillus sp. Bpr_S20]MCL1700753.1 hypothetical protein [Lysinibacillus sp. Bpr_S20]